MSADLRAAASAWIAGDPDPGTRAELQALLDAGDDAGLERCVQGRLTFGTAGLRGVVGPGPARMNRAVVLRATRALVEHLLAHEPDARARPVVLGYDARRDSERLAGDVAGVLAAAGLTVRGFDHPVPTPLVAFAAKELGAVAAIVVTASHNPPEYNGYKVYGSLASQIVAPVDTDIERRMGELGPATEIPLVALPHPAVAPPPAGLFARYLAALDAERPRVSRDLAIPIVYTPLHGVGARYARLAFEHAGYAHVSIVPEQAEPDAEFPTVRFPNPEEPGALALALALATKERAELVLANDPDADRLAAAVISATGTWRVLSGNQIGLLLADYLLEHAPSGQRSLVVESIVSSPLLARIAAERGAACERTLTGFKWIALAARTRSLELGERFVFGFEEALGYSVASIVRDKDGISAAVLLADLAAHERVSQRSLLDRLADLYRRHGVWASRQVSVVREGSAGQASLGRALDDLAEAPPSELAGRSVVRFTDFRGGAVDRPPWLGAAPLMELELEGGGRVLARPSGTEPKLKIYVDLPEPLGASDTVPAAEARAEGRAAELASALLARMKLT